MSRATDTPTGTIWDSVDDLNHYMGNFYTNIVLHGPDLVRVVTAAEALDLPAYLATDGKAVVVYDEKCDEQDAKELESLARKFSRDLGCVALAAGNHDDDVLWYTLVRNGELADKYDSCPGYFGRGSRAPQGGDANRLCEAFGASAREAEVAALLRRGRSEVTFEVDRHRELLELLGVSVELGLVGYGYVSAGELSQGESITMRAVCGAPEPGALVVSSALSLIAPETSKRLEEEGEYIANHSAELVLSHVNIPSRFAALFGGESMNAYLAFWRLRVVHRQTEAAEHARSCSRRRSPRRVCRRARVPDAVVDARSRGEVQHHAAHSGRE